MPPKKPTAEDFPKKSTTDEFVEALLEPRVVEAISVAMADTISKLIQSTLEVKLEALLNRVAALETQADTAQTERTTLAEENKELRQRLEDIDAYSRSDNLVFHGLKTSTYSEAVGVRSEDASSSQGSHSDLPNDIHLDCERAVIEFCNTVLNVPLSKSDISLAHRLPKRPTDLRPAGVIVRFTNRRARNAVFYGRRALKKGDVRVFVNEQLTTSRAAILKEGRKLVKEKKLQGAWTNNGSVYIRLSDLPTSRPVKVQSIRDLPSG